MVASQILAVTITEAVRTMQAERVVEAEEVKRREAAVVEVVEEEAGGSPTAEA